ncbi:MAG: efflux RND transporter permease subunit [Pseudomonadota bacterium]
MEALLARWLVRYRHLWLFLALSLTAWMGVGAKNLWFDNDYRIFFREDDPQLVANERLQNEFTRTDNLSFILAPANGDVFTRENLAAVEWLTTEAWKLPRSIRVDSLSNFQNTQASGDDLSTNDLIRDARSYSDAQLAEKKRTALSEPLLVNALVSKTGHVTAVSVKLELPQHRGVPDETTPEVMFAARDLYARFEQNYPQFKTYLTGLIPVNQGFNELAQRDSVTLVPIMFVIVVLLLVLFLRSLSAALVTVVIIALSLVMAIGFTGWVGYHLNQINVSAPTIILTLAISDSVHLLLTYLEGLGQGRSRAQAMERSLSVNLMPVFFTNFTTAIGFAGLNYSDSPPFREMGNVAAFGVIGTMFLAFTVLPAVMMWLPVRIKPGMGEDAHWKIIDDICEFALRHRRRLMWGTLALVAVTASFIPRNELNDDTVAYFAKGLDIRESMDFVEENLTGIDTLSYELRSGETSGISDPLFLKKVEAFAEWYRQQPGVAHISSFTTVIKRLNKNMHGDDPAFYRIPDDRDLTAQYILLYELSLPQGLDVNDLVNFDKSSLRFSVSIHNLKSQGLIDLEAQAQAWLKAHAPEIATPGSSPSLMFAHIGQNNINSMVDGAFVSILLISATMIIALRSVLFGALSIIPNLLPSVMAFGLWGMFSGEVNLAVAAVFNVSSGIVIDDTIHFLSKYLRARRKDGKTPEDAVRYSFATTGSALFVNTAVLVLGFLVLTVSDFTANATLGMMTALCIAVALLFDLLFLPALLTRFDNLTPKRP